MSVLGGLGMISLDIVFMARLSDMEVAGTAVGGYLTELCTQRSRRARFRSLTDRCAAGASII